MASDIRSLPLGGRFSICKYRSLVFDRVSDFRGLWITVRRAST